MGDEKVNWLFLHTIVNFSSDDICLLKKTKTGSHGVHSDLELTTFEYGPEFSILTLQLSKCWDYVISYDI